MYDIIKIKSSTWRWADVQTNEEIPGEKEIDNKSTNRLVPGSG